MKECLKEDENLEKFFIEVSSKGYVYNRIAANGASKAFLRFTQIV